MIRILELKVWERMVRIEKWV